VNTLTLLTRFTRVQRTEAQDVSGCTAFLGLKAWPLWLEVARVGQAFYPELLGTLCTLAGEQGSAVKFFISAIKKHIDPVTALKIQIHLGDPEAGLLNFGLTRDDLRVPSRLKSS